MSKFVGWTYLSYNWQYYILRPWAFFRDLYKDIRSILQRGIRGWADSDTWSLDYSIAQWMPDALTFLKKNKHGIPAEFSPIDNSIPFKEGEKAWDAIMDKMILAFQISKDSNMWPDLPKNYDAMTKKEQHAWWKATHKEQARLEKIRMEGMLLFGKYFHSLWD